jgi:hypothetical protein
LGKCGEIKKDNRKGTTSYEGAKSEGTVLETIR